MYFLRLYIERLHALWSGCINVAAFGVASTVRHYAINYQQQMLS